MNTPSPHPLRIACVDDNPLIGESLDRRIRLEPGLEWVGSVIDSSPAGIGERVAALRPHVVLVDIDLPGIDAFAMVERFIHEMPSVRFVMFSGHLNREYIERALDCGAWGYLSKNDDVAVVLAGIRKVGDEQIALSAEAEAVLRGSFS